MKAAAGPRASPAKALVLWGSGAAAGPSGKWREYHPASSMSNPSFKESAARSFGQSASSLDLERCGVTIRVSEQWSCSTYLLLKDVACVTCSQVVISSLSCCRSYSLPTGCFFCTNHFDSLTIYLHFETFSTVVWEMLLNTLQHCVCRWTDP